MAINKVIRSSPPISIFWAHVLHLCLENKNRRSQDAGGGWERLPEIWCSGSWEGYKRSKKQIQISTWFGSHLDDFKSVVPHPGLVQESNKGQHLQWQETTFWRWWPSQGRDHQNVDLIWEHQERKMELRRSPDTKSAKAKHLQFSRCC